MRNSQTSESISGRATSKPEAQILPYVLYEGGAYQLPAPLGLELKNKIQGTLSFGYSGKELTEKLAFLSSSQIRTLQTLLRYDLGDRVRKLAHIEVTKKSSMRFWRKSAKATIAFIEGEMSNMPEGISLVVPDLTSTGTKDEGSRLSQNAAFVGPQQQILGQSSALRSEYDSDPELSGGERSRRVWGEPANSTRAWSVRRQNDIHHIPVAPPTPVQSPGPPNLTNMAGMFGVQDVTHLLVADEERRKRLAEYKVWVIQPFWSVDQTGSPNNVWDRCVILEERPKIPDVERRLTALDKNSMTVFDKMRTLTVSQQMQVQQSLEEVKSGASDPEYQLKLRQLDIVRSTEWFKQSHVKKIIVYTCPEPLSPALKRHEESQSHRPQPKESLHNLPYNIDNPSEFPRHRVSSLENKKIGDRGSLEGVAGTDREYYTASAENSRWGSRRPRGRNEIREDTDETDEDFIRRRQLRDSTHDIQRANEAIANRSPRPPGSPERSQRPIMRRQSSAYSRTRSPTTTRSRRPSTTPGSVPYADYYYTDDDSSLDSGGYNGTKIFVHLNFND